MSEEIRNPNTELHDAALSGVSGGKSHAETVLEVLCYNCSHYKVSCWTWSELVNHIESYGNPDSPEQCPFYNA